MKSLLCSLAFVLFASFSSMLFAQHYEKGRYVTSTTHQLIIPDGGNLDEALRLSSRWAEAVLKKHPNMLDVRYLLSEVEADTMQLLVLYEFESIKDADSAGVMVKQLVETEWPDPIARRAFFAALGDYINPALNHHASYWEIVTSH